MSARAIGSASISFGLVNIPVKLYTAASAEGISFHLLHKKCGGRLKQQYICPTDANEVVERAEMAKGYEFAKGQYVLFSEQELAALESPRNDSLEILEFVPLDSVDFVYVAKTYYLGPDKGGDKAYHLLNEAMGRTGKVAVGRHFTRGREQLSLVRPYQDGLLLHHVYYADEVRSFEEVDRGATFTFHPVESELADKLILQLASDEFRPDKFKDTYGDRVRSAIEQKASGQGIVRAPEQVPAQVIDLFEALKKSLAAAPAANGTAESRAPSPETQAAALDAARAPGSTPELAASDAERGGATPAPSAPGPEAAPNGHDERPMPPKKAEPRRATRRDKQARGGTG